MRLGIFGGTFDPPHIGHVLVAVDAFEALALDKLIFVPARIQPLKAGQDSAPAHHRLAMVRLLVGADERFDVDPVEMDRAGLSYTVDTLRTFAQRHPDAARIFLVGEDAIAAFEAWREPQEILKLAQLAVLRRRSGPRDDTVNPPDGTIAVATRLVEVSSTEIRERVRAGKSVRGFVPESVAAYIETERLYR